MFKDTPAFASFSVDDLGAAKEFYGGVLGLDMLEDEMGILRLTVSGSSPVIIYPKPNHSPASFTVLNFQVSDIETTVDELTARGVKFEHYDIPEMKTNAKGIADAGEGPKIAWFTDPAGNILSVLEEY